MNIYTNETINKYIFIYIYVYIYVYMVICMCDFFGAARNMEENGTVALMGICLRSAPQDHMSHPVLNLLAL